ncbi:hypothetical protein HDV00_012019 [Rhizophlyctis rosea]|nr:hypothetical protein HDV00_012019 [Rhizophlyctis rosea]
MGKKPSLIAKEHIDMTDEVDEVVNHKRRRLVKKASNTSLTTTSDTDHVFVNSRRQMRTVTTTSDSDCVMVDSSWRPSARSYTRQNLSRNRPTEEGPTDTSDSEEGTEDDSWRRENAAKRSPSPIQISDSDSDQPTSLLSSIDDDDDDDDDDDEDDDDTASSETESSEVADSDDYWLAESDIEDAYDNYADYNPDGTFDKTRALAERAQEQLQLGAIRGDIRSDEEDEERTSGRKRKNTHGSERRYPEYAPERESMELPELGDKTIGKLASDYTICGSSLHSFVVNDYEIVNLHDPTSYYSLQPFRTWKGGRNAVERFRITGLLKNGIRYRMIGMEWFYLESRQGSLICAKLPMKEQPVWAILRKPSEKYRAARGKHDLAKLTVLDYAIGYLILNNRHNPENPVKNVNPQAFRQFAKLRAAEIGRDWDLVMEDLGLTTQLVPTFLSAEREMLQCMVKQRLAWRSGLLSQVDRAILHHLVRRLEGPQKLKKPKYKDPSDFPALVVHRDVAKAYDVKNTYAGFRFEIVGTSADPNGFSFNAHRRKRKDIEGYIPRPGKHRDFVLCKKVESTQKYDVCDEVIIRDHGKYQKIRRGDDVAFEPDASDVTYKWKSRIWYGRVEGFYKANGDLRFSDHDDDDVEADEVGEPEEIKKGDISVHVRWYLLLPDTSLWKPFGLKDDPKIAAGKRENLNSDPRNTLQYRLLDLSELFMSDERAGDLDKGNTCPIVPIESLIGKVKVHRSWVTCPRDRWDHVFCRGREVTEVRASVRRRGESLNEFRAWDPHGEEGGEEKDASDADGEETCVVELRPKEGRGISDVVEVKKSDWRKIKEGEYLKGNAFISLRSYLKIDGSDCQCGCRERAIPDAEFIRCGVEEFFMYRGGREVDMEYCAEGLPVWLRDFDVGVGPATRVSLALPHVSGASH